MAMILLNFQFVVTFFLLIQQCHTLYRRPKDRITGCLRCVGRNELLDIDAGTLTTTNDHEDNGYCRNIYSMIGRVLHSRDYTCTYSTNTLMVSYIKFRSYFQLNQVTYYHNHFALNNAPDVVKFGLGSDTRLIGITKSLSVFNHGRLARTSNPHSWAVNEPVATNELVFFLKLTINQHFRLTMLGCRFTDYAPALLSTTPIDSFGVISHGGINPYPQDLTSCIIDNVGEGYLPIRNGDGVNTAIDSTFYYIQVDFPVTYKVVRIDRQVKKGGTTGGAFIQFGQDENTLDFFKGPTNTVEQLVPSEDDWMDYLTVTDTFVQPLIGKMFRYVPRCTPGTCYASKIQFYGVPLTTPDHHWPLMGHGRDEYRIHDLVNSPSSSFDGFVYDVPEDVPSRSVEFVDPDDCLLDPKNCKDGLAIEFSIQDVQPNPRKMSVVIPSSKVFNIAASGTCTTNDGAQVDLNVKFGVFVELGENMLLRGMDIDVTLVNENQVDGTDGAQYQINAKIFLGKDEAYATACQFDVADAYASRDITVKIEGAKISFLLDATIEEAIKDLAFWYHRTIFIYFTPINGQNINGKLDTSSQMKLEASYHFRCQKTLKSYALKSADWFQDNGCHSASDARVSKPHISWEACNLPSSSLIMAFKDPILLKSFEIMGSGRGEFNTVTSFKMEYKFRIITESIDHHVFDWRPYQLNGQDYIFKRRLTKSQQMPEIIPLPYAVFVTNVKVIPLDYIGLGADLRIDVNVCQLDEYVTEREMWHKLNSDNVCFGLKGKNPGQFSSEKGVEATFIKLVHKSGTVGAGDYPTQFWNHRDEEQIAIYLTNKDDEVVAPAGLPLGATPSHDFHSNNLPTDPEITLALQGPTYFRNKEKLRVWYAMDLNGQVADMGTNQICVDVYGWGKTYNYHGMHRISSPNLPRRCVYRPSNKLHVHEDACSSSEHHFFFDVFGYLHWNEFHLYVKINGNSLVATDAKHVKHQISTNDWIDYRPNVANKKWYVKRLSDGTIYYAHVDDNNDAEIELRSDSWTQFGFHPADRSFYQYYRDDSVTKTEPGNFDAVKTACEASGGTLVEPRSFDEMELLAEKFTAADSDIWHIGVTAMPSNTKYRFISGNPFPNKLFHPGDGLNTGEDAVVYRPTDKMFVDYVTTAVRRGICEATDPQWRGIKYGQFFENEQFFPLLSFNMDMKKTFHTGKGFHISYSYKSKKLFVVISSSFKYRLTVENQEITSRTTFLVVQKKTDNETYIRLYKDGVQIGENITATSAINPLNEGFFNYTIFGQSYHDFYPNLKFKMDNVKIWKHFVEPDEIIASSAIDLKDFSDHNEFYGREEQGYVIKSSCLDSDLKDGLCRDRTASNGFVKETTEVPDSLPDISGEGFTELQIDPIDKLIYFLSSSGPVYKMASHNSTELEKYCSGKSVSKIQADYLGVLYAHGSDNKIYKCEAGSWQEVTVDRPCHSLQFKFETKYVREGNKWYKITDLASGSTEEVWNGANGDFFFSHSKEPFYYVNHGSSLKRIHKDGLDSVDLSSLSPVKIFVTFSERIFFTEASKIIFRYERNEFSTNYHDNQRPYWTAVSYDVRDIVFCDALGDFVVCIRENDILTKFSFPDSVEPKKISRFIAPRLFRRTISTTSDWQQFRSSDENAWFLKNPVAGSRYFTFLRFDIQLPAGAVVSLARILGKTSITTTGRYNVSISLVESLTISEQDDITDFAPVDGVFWYTRELSTESHFVTQNIAQLVQYASDKRKQIRTDGDDLAIMLAFTHQDPAGLNKLAKMLLENMILEVYYQSASKNKYVGFPYSPTHRGSIYTSTTHVRAQKISFWVYFHGESLLVLWKINSDLTRDMVYTTSSSSFSSDVWHEINLALDAGTIYPMKVEFQVFTNNDDSQVGIDDVKFLAENTGSLTPFTSTYNYRETDSTTYQSVLTAMNLPSPKILYPFANFKEELLLADYGPNNLNLQKQNENVKIVSNNHNRFGLPDHSATIHGGSTHALFQEDCSSVTNDLTQFTILLQYYDFNVAGGYQHRGILFLSESSGTDQQFLHFQSSGKLILRLVGNGGSPSGDHELATLEFQKTNYVALVYDNGRLICYVNNQVTYDSSLTIIIQKRIEFRTHEGNQAAISCFQFYDQVLNNMQIKALELCPNLQNGAFYNNVECENGGVHVFPYQDCLCPGDHVTKTTTCTNDFPQFENALLYIPMDEDLESSKGSFTPGSPSNKESQPSPVNNAQCITQDGSLTSIGTFTHSCLSDFTGCPEGYVFNFWVKFDSHSVHDTKIHVLKLGEISWFNTYKVSGDVEARIEWQSEDICFMEFACPVNAWAYVSLHVNETHLNLLINGEEVTDKTANCTVPETRSPQLQIEVGGVSAPICLDDISLVPVESMEDVITLYRSLTADATDMNRHNKAATIGLRVTGDFSDLIQDELFNQDIPEALTHARLRDLINSTIGDLQEKARDDGLMLYSQSTIKKIKFNNMKKNEVRKNSAGNKIFHDIEMTLQYDYFSYVDRLFFDSTQEFINHGRAYYFEVMNVQNSVVSTQSLSATITDNQPDPFQTQMTLAILQTDLQTRFHQGYTMVMSVFGSSNITTKHVRMGGNQFTFLAPPYRLVTLSLYPVTHGGHGPAQEITFLTNKQVNLVPPTVISLLSVDLTQDQLEVKWEHYDLEHWGGDEVGYTVAYKKVIDYEDFSFNLNDGYTIFEAQANMNVDDTIFEMANSAELSYTFTGLEPFTLYSVLVCATNEIGNGSCFEVRNRTAEGVPEAGPHINTTEALFLEESDVARITWIPVDLTNQEDLDFLNSYSYNEYQLQLRSHLSSATNTQISETVPAGSNHINFTLTNDDFLTFHLDISITNNFGTGPPRNICFALGENVPSGAPALLENFDKTAWVLNLTVGNVALPAENGIITHYNVTYKAREFDDDLHIMNSTFREHLPQDVEVWDLMKEGVVNCTYFEENEMPLSSKPLNFSITNLFPFTTYDVNVYPCTIVGCSDSSMSGEFVTDETTPSCVPNVTMANSSSTSLLVNWHHLTHQCIHGVLQDYLLLIYESEIVPPVYNNNKTTDQVTLDVTDLEKYWNYSLVLYARNNAGYGPASDPIWAMTEEDIPEGPPTNVSYQPVNSTALNITMMLPERHLVNGIILQYKVRYWTTEDAEKTVIVDRVEEDTITSVVISGLREFFNHSVRISAFTKFGWGPESEETLMLTDEDVPSAPPVDFEVLSTSHIYLTLTWGKIPLLSTHGIMRNFSLQCNGTLANGSLHKREETVLYEEAMEYYQFNMTDLFPHTIYNCSIKGCTTPGCGPITMVSNKTLEFYPSGTVQSIIQVNHNETESLYIEYTDVLPLEKKGNITHFNISVNKVENTWEEEDNTTQYYRVDGGTFQFSIIGGLDNYTEYFITITPYTLIGPGPTHANVTFRTAANLPTRSPEIFFLQNISSSALNVQWKAPNSSYCEGPLQGFVIFFRLTDEHIVCNLFDNCTTPNSTFVNQTTFSKDLMDLELHSNYTLWMAAQTERGLGVPTDIFMVMTDAFVNGNWTIWTSWGECDASCGLGYSRRLRWCTNPEPSAGGSDCEGDPAEALPCNDFACPAMYLAENGIDCEDTCTHINESYGCFNKLNTHEANQVFITARDPSNYTLVVNITCDEAPSSAVTAYSRTLHPSYDVITGECSGYKDAPLKINCTAEEIIDSNTRRLCYCVDIESMGYEEWAPWSPCTQPCDVGTQTRFRNCLMERGCNKVVDRKDCNTFQCPIHGAWGQWTEYGSCDRTCGFGNRMRTRKCDDPLPQHDGDYCPGTDEEIISGCNPYPCPIHGVWSDWHMEDFCKKPCGGDAYRLRYRYCNNPPPKYNGQECPGDSEIRLPCNTERACKERIEVDFVAKLVDYNWDFTMVYKDQQAFLDVESDVKYACMQVLNETVGAQNILDIQVNQLSRGSVITNFTITYQYVPYIEVLVMQDAIDKVGKIHTLNISHINVTSKDVPTLPPVFTVHSPTPFTLEVNWDPVDNSSLNGVRYLYYVYYRQLDHPDRLWEVTGTSNLTLTIKDLKPLTLYGLRMTVSIEEGNGVASLEQEVWTIEGVPYIKPPNGDHSILSYDTVYFNWDAISVNQVPGVLRGYQITYRSYFDNSTLVSRTSPDLLQRTITGMTPNTWYWVEIAGFTNKGLGPEHLLIFQTPPGPPVVPPPNITIYERYSTEEIKITWNQIPNEFRMGLMRGYKVRYQLIRTSGLDIPVQPIITIAHDRFVLFHVFKGLRPYSEYKIELFGYADEGDGPAATLYASTCACPEIVYANFLKQPPFVVTNPRNSSDVTGFFPDLMTKILMEVCVHCDAYRPTIYYDRTGLGYPSKKINMAKVKEGVDEGTHLNFPFFGRFEIEKYEGFYPYIGIIYSQGVAMIVKDVKVKNLGFVNILLAISKAWSVLFVGVLMSAICGWVFWFTEQGSEETEISLDRPILGALQGLWMAYVTMTTVGYGDFVPTTIRSKAVMIFWVLIGLVTMGVITGVISSGLTVGDQEGAIKLYGTLTATLPDSFERRLAILRNAVVDERNRTTVEDLFDAVANGEVVVALLDATVAAGYEDVLKAKELRAMKIIDTNSGYGITLSGGLEPLEADIRSYVAANRPVILEYQRKNIPRLVPTLADPEFTLISEEEVVAMMTYMGIAFAVICFFAFIMSLIRKKRERMVKPEEPFTSSKYYDVMETFVNKFNQEYEEKIEKMVERQFNDFNDLQVLRQNYGRLLARAGYRKDVIEDSFNKKKKKDVRSIVRKKRNERLEEIINRTSGADGYFGVCNEAYER